MTAYYNEIDPYCVQWLRNLIDAGLIASGEVDERSVEDVSPSEVAEFKQCHFFAGIGVWSHSLRAAGWEDSRRCWTGSCPCQPFSTAGKGAGFADERHLWPSFYHLITERRPNVIFGEQVAGKNGLAWLDLVQADLEGLEYAVSPVPMAAAGFGAPHVRERLYWMAYAHDARSQRRDSGELQECTRQRIAGKGSSQDGMAKSESVKGYGSGDERGGRGEPSNSDNVDSTNPTNGFWRDADWLYCTDGKWRSAESGTFPLADGPARRVDQIRAYGNALVAPQAQAFIEAAMEFLP